MEARGFKYFLVLISIFVMAFGAFQFSLFLTRGNDWLHLVFSILTICTAVGLLRKLAWARYITVVLLWVGIFGAIGAVTPFAASDEINEINVPVRVGLVVLAIIAILFALHILGKNKLRFLKKIF